MYRYRFCSLYPVTERPQLWIVGLFVFSCPSVLCICLLEVEVETRSFFLYVSKNTQFFWENLTAVVGSVFFISPRLLVFWLQSQCRLFAFSLLSYKPSFTLTALQVLLTNSINWACVQDEVWQQWSVLFTSTKAWIHYSKAVTTQRCHFPSISPRQCCIVFVNYEFQPQSAHSPLE